MNSVRDENQLPEKRYRNKLKKILKKLLEILKSIRNRIGKLKKLKETGK